MSVTVGFQGSSESNASVQYFDVSVPTNGKGQNLTDLWSSTTNAGKKITVQKDFVATKVLLATVPNSVSVDIAFTKDNVTLSDSKTELALKQGGDIVWPGGVITASIKK